MKKKLQKYLSGEREGFSLVELIIVIAIMAILIGIIALAVIPYLEKSREGKDQQTVDTVYSAYQNTIAECQSKGVAVQNVTLPLTGTANDFEKILLEAINSGDGTGADICNKLISDKAKTGGAKTIVCTYTAATKTIEVKAGTIVSSNH